MRIDYFERKLRLKDIEVWDVRVENSAYCFIVMDENRPPKIEDLFLLMDLKLKKMNLEKT